MKKKIIILILSLTLLAMTPRVLAYAENGHSHPVCGVSCQENHKTLEWTALTFENISEIAADVAQVDSSPYYVFETGNYYLSEDITLLYDVNIPEGVTVNLCLNGKTLTGTGEHSVFLVENGGALNLTDCCMDADKTGGAVTGGVSAYGGAVNNNGMFCMYGGRLLGNSSTGPNNAPLGGGGIANFGTAYMYGGTIISNNSRTNQSVSGDVIYVGIGGGVFNIGDFHMYGGSIAGNSGQDSGGGVWNSNKGTFLMHGGSITENRAGYGAGISNTGTFVMNNGTISKNTASIQGGGVTTRGTFTINGGAITGNKAYVNSNYYSNMYGGGIYVADGTLTVTGGEISNNSISHGSGTSAKGKDAIGGGVYVHKGSLILTGGSITDNHVTTTGTASDDVAQGGGIYITKNGTLQVSGVPVVSGNTAGNISNNIHLAVDGLVTVGTDVDGNGTKEYLMTGAVLAITPGVAPTDSTPFTVTTAGNRDNSAFFAADDASHVVINQGNDDTQIVCLMYHPSCTGAAAIIENETKATCTKDGGYDTVVYCGECGKELSREHTTITTKGHNYESSIIAPDCTNGGYTTYTCSVCGDTYTGNHVTALGHNEVADKGYAATCTNTGLTDGKHCDRCDEVLVKQESIAALGHNEVIDNGYAATCTEAGLSDGKHCDRCDEVLVKQENIAALGHNEVLDKGYAATCTATGLSDGKHCDRCDEVLLKQESITALGHNWDEGKVTTEPTVETEGIRTYTCGNCQETKTEKIPTLNHVHSYTPKVTEATCTENGYSTYICACGDTFIANEVAALGHNEVIDKGYAATCTKTGLSDGTHCGRCDTVLTNQEVITALGHDWDEGKVTTEPTEETTGVCSYVCGTCGANKTETIPKLEHVHNHTSVVTAPTCTVAGYTTYTCICGDTYIDDEVTALGHNEVIDKGYAATCTEAGLSEGKHCERCNTVLVKQEAITALGHSWDEGKVTTEPTEEDTGICTYTCETCGETKTEVIPALGHIHNHTSVVIAPTCSEDGYTTYTCACGDSYIADFVDATGHSFENGICGSCGAADPDYEPEKELFELHGANMILGNNLAMNFYIEVADIDPAEDYYAVITKESANGEDLVVTIQDVNWQKYSSNLYRVSLDKIAAKEMADEVTVVIYNDIDEQVSKTWVDSVRDYTMRMLEKEEGKDDPNEEQLALYVEMLNYGAAAQDHFDYNEDDPANNELTAAQKEYGLGTVEMEDFRVEGAGYVGTNLTLESNILMNFFFNNIPAEHDDMYAIATYTDHYGEAKQIKVEGEDFVKHNSTTWKISVSGLVIADCRQLVDVKVYNSENEVIASAVDSIESYTARMDGDGPLFIAIMKFAVAAYNTFH